MKIEQTVMIRKVYKDPVDLWCVKAVREADGRSEVTYIGFKVKPKVKPGQILKPGDEI